MQKCMVKLLLTAILLFIPTGCWDRHELNDLAIVSAIGFDKIGDKYHVIVQVLDPNEVSRTATGGTGNASVVMYEEKGTTVDDAIGRLTAKAPYTLYLSHTRIIIIGEQLAKEGISGVLDYLSRERQMRTDFYMVIARKSKAHDILSIFTPIEKIPGNKLYNSLKTSAKEWGPVQATQLVDVINDLVNGGKQLVLTGLVIEGNAKEGGTKKSIENIRSVAKMAYKGIGVFKGDKLIGWMSEYESKGYSYIRNDMTRTVGFVSCGKEKYVSLRVIRSGTSLSVKMRSGEPVVQINLEIEADVNETTCDIDLENEQTIADLEEKGGQRTKMLIDKSIARAKKLRSDIFGFGDLLERREPAYWRANKARWEELFPELAIETDIKYSIRRVGTRTNSLLREMED